MQPVFLGVHVFVGWLVMATRTPQEVKNSVDADLDTEEGIRIGRPVNGGGNMKTPPPKPPKPGPKK